MRTKQAIRLFPILVLVVFLGLLAGGAMAQTDEGTPFLGANVQEDPAGVVVVNLLPDGPGMAAGLEAGDIITAVNGTTVSYANLLEVLGEYAVGDEVELAVLRGDETLTLTAMLGNRADFTLPEAETTPEPAVVARPYLGVSVEDTEDGLVVREVAAGSPAEAAGLQVEDVVTAVNGEAVANTADLVAIIGALNVDDTVTLEYTRDGETLSAEITLAANPNAQTFVMPGRGLGRGDTPRGPRGQGMMPGMPFGFDAHHGDMIVYDAASETWRLVNVSEDGPLYVAGLRTADVISAVNGEPVGPDALSSLLDELDAEADVTLTVERDGESQEIVVSASALTGLLMPMRGFGGMYGFDDLDEMMPFSFGMPMMGQIGVRLGVTFVNLSAETAEANEVDVTEGALVTAVDADSPAAESGLQEGDIIAAVDGDVIDEERTLRDRLFAYEPDDTVTLTVLRDGEELSLEVTLDAAQAGTMRGFEDMLPFFHGGEMPGMPDMDDLLIPEDAPTL